MEAAAAAVGNTLSLQAFLWLACAAFLATVVRGFSGFGTAMIYLPLASMVLEPVWAIITMIVFDIIGPLPMIPRALREGHPVNVLWLGGGALCALPFGVYLLSKTDPIAFRWVVSLLALILLLVLTSGWRYRGVLTQPKMFATGAVGGFMGGFVGLPGPPVILFYMSSPENPSVIRANTMLYLMLYSFCAPCIFWFKGMLDFTPVIIGLCLIIPCMLGGLLGQGIFDPTKERGYRMVAYLIIAASALAGLPIFS